MKRFVSVLIALFTTFIAIIVLVISEAIRRDWPDAAFWVRFVVIAIVLSVSLAWFRAKCKRDHENEIDEMVRKEKEKKK